MSAIESPTPQQEPEKLFSYFSRENEQLYKDILFGHAKQINDHDYACILGDDKSSRIPALVLGRAINTIYKSRHEPAAPVLFVDPAHYTATMLKTDSQQTEKFNNQFRELTKSHGVETGTKVLLVTDFVRTGNTIRSFENLCREAGLNVEIVQNSKWHETSSASLVDNPDEQSLHALPKYIHIDDEEDAAQQIKRFEESGTSFLLLLKVAKHTGIVTREIAESFSREGEREIFFKFIREKLSLDEQKHLFTSVREAQLAHRKQLGAFAEKLAKYFVENQPGTASP